MKPHEVHDQYNSPQCRCGQGKMVVRCGGKFANHPGRYYYKCPLNAKHAQSFIWCDEFQASNPTIENQVFQRQPPVHRGCSPDLLSSTVIDKSATETATSNPTRSRTLSDLETHIAVIFMSMVLVLLGVILGKML
ncbi:hypothetical protein AAHA92_00386 [Salvia divinorum]|uniref:GRF-type domain-containing protein n=1 Tax=Salvia divinorum TaxID=28513 RepID=A0ABD1GM86_SALDI